MPPREGTRPTTLQMGWRKISRRGGETRRLWVSHGPRCRRSGGWTLFWNVSMNHGWGRSFRAWIGCGPANPGALPRAGVCRAVGAPGSWQALRVRAHRVGRLEDVDSTPPWSPPTPLEKCFPYVSASPRLGARFFLCRNDSVGSVVLARSAPAFPSSFARYGRGTGPRLAHSLSCEGFRGAVSPIPNALCRPRMRGVSWHSVPRGRRIPRLGCDPPSACPEAPCADGRHATCPNLAGTWVWNL